MRGRIARCLRELGEGLPRVDLGYSKQVGSECEVYRPWDPGIVAQGPSHRWHIWILDVDGLRVVVQSTGCPGTSAQHRSELEAIVGSIEFGP